MVAGAGGRRSRPRPERGKRRPRPPAGRLPWASPRTWLRDRRRRKQRQRWSGRVTLSAPPLSRRNCSRGRALPPKSRPADRPARGSRGVRACTRRAPRASGARSARDVVPGGWKCVTGRGGRAPPRAFRVPAGPAPRVPVPRVLPALGPQFPAALRAPRLQSFAPPSLSAPARGRVEEPCTEGSGAPRQGVSRVGSRFAQAHCYSGPESAAPCAIAHLAILSHGGARTWAPTPAVRGARLSYVERASPRWDGQTAPVWRTGSSGYRGSG
ncbi:uncharacterized protein LOC126070642 isoform X2 [Elephas maximus indicus]|uniref:uncharacterized protein LOC126070642 isoform X2 n=1 Tax=Elephas maximus indicus TaxID=99487 RepID=UPI0021163B83|nr:uncharacterized protein LOC126070642 isoform X2 [Elephas maximus indicus]XP_049730976.1 uncharacterized protein LOC126070642 isoform X2 [Elephas maximus indicus]XP_049730977.1 uncharacterized protein LOC126070642 isoform X2 [Elephas maximus indicus]